MYARTEVRLYAELFPMMLARGFQSIPHAYLAECDLRGWVDDHERATEPANPNMDHYNLLDQCQGRCHDIGMHLQDTLSRFTAQFLNASGGSRSLHAAAWQDVALLAQPRLEPVQFSFGNAQSQGTGRYGGRVARFSTAFAEPLRRANQPRIGYSNWDTEWRGMPSTFRIKSRPMTLTLL
jgi:hypothetical protein